MRLGVCTGGGDCPGLNAAIRAIVKEANGVHGLDVIGIQDSFNGLMEDPPKGAPLNFSDVTDILYKGGTIIGTHNRGNPYSGADKQLVEERINKTLEGARTLGLDALIVIGGDGTQAISSLFQERGLNIIGIPKTIDNDLPGSDSTIGFSTAVDVVTDAIQRLQSTAESHDRVMVLEVMGRNSGFIALHGGIAGGAHAILIPEVPFDSRYIEEKLKERKALGRNFSVVVVAEGAKEIGTGAFTKTENDGKANLGGVGTHVANTINRLTGMETRVTVLGHVQRGGSPNPSDRVLATRFAHRAVSLALKSTFGVCVAMKGEELYEIPLERFAEGEQRQVDLNSDTVATAESIGITLGREFTFSTQKKG